MSVTTTTSETKQEERKDSDADDVKSEAVPHSQESKDKEIDDVSEIKFSNYAVRTMTRDELFAHPITRRAMLLMYKWVLAEDEDDDQDDERRYNIDALEFLDIMRDCSGNQKLFARWQHKKYAEILDSGFSESVDESAED
jgi:hypothetical protein